MFLLLALKRYACIVFAVGLFVFVFLFIYPKGGYQSKDAIKTRTNFCGNGDHKFRISERIELHIGKRLCRGGQRKQSFVLTIASEHRFVNPVSKEIASFVQIHTLRWFCLC